MKKASIQQPRASYMGSGTYDSGGHDDDVDNDDASKNRVNNAQASHGNKAGQTTQQSTPITPEHLQALLVKLWTQALTLKTHLAWSGTADPYVDFIVASFLGHNRQEAADTPRKMAIRGRSFLSHDRLTDQRPYEETSREATEGYPHTSEEIATSDPTDWVMKNLRRIEEQLENEREKNRQKDEQIEHLLQHVEKLELENHRYHQLLFSKRNDFDTPGERGPSGMVSNNLSGMNDGYEDPEQEEIRRILEELGLDSLPPSA